MPYYVFSVRPFAQLSKLAEFADFRAASAQAKALRGQSLAPGERIKVMFAESEDMAVDLLCQVRDPGPIGDD